MASKLVDLLVLGKRLYVKYESINLTSLWAKKQALSIICEIAIGNCYWAHRVRQDCYTLIVRECTMTYCYWTFNTGAFHYMYSSSFTWGERTPGYFCRCDFSKHYCCATVFCIMECGVFHSEVRYVSKAFSTIHEIEATDRHIVNIFHNNLPWCYTLNWWRVVTVSTNQSKFPCIE